MHRDDIYMWRVEFPFRFLIKFPIQLYGKSNHESEKMKKIKEKYKKKLFF